MTHTTPTGSRAGMTIVELSVLMFVLLFMVGMSFIGVRAWKSGSDRAACVLNIYHAQEAVRSFSNVNGYRPGEALASVDVEYNVFGEHGYLLKRPECPAGGDYFTKGNTIPNYGTLYLTCSLAVPKRHRPDSFEQW